MGQRLGTSFGGGVGGFATRVDLCEQCADAFDKWLKERHVETSMVTHRRIHHAAHHVGGGWDLEEWDSVQRWNEPSPKSIPRDAEKHSGYIDAQGRQHVIFLRKAAMGEGHCERCRPRKAS